MKIYTWDTQGDFTNDKKLATINSFNDPNHPVFVCIQEGGMSLNLDRQGIKSGGWVVFDGQAVGVSKEPCTCTNYILVNKGAQRLPLVRINLTDKHGGVLLGNGKAARTPVAIRCGADLIVSWHSLSGPDNSDTFALINALEREAGNKGIERVIVGGNFNAEPDEVDQLLSVGNRRTLSQRTLQQRLVGRAGAPTQGRPPNREFDFFVYMARQEVGQPVFQRPQVYRVGLSDHDPVLIFSREGA